MAYRDSISQFSVISNIINKTENKEYDISDKIKSIVVDKDYVNNIFPYFVISIYATEELRKIIRNNDVSISLTINEVNVDFEAINSDENITSNRDIKDSCLSTVLKVFNKDLSDIALPDDIDDNSEDDAVKNKSILISLECIPEKELNKNSKIVNTSYYKASMDEMIVDILSDDDNDIYINPSENKNREDSVLIPQQNIYNSILFLQDNYGIYNSKMLFFLDTDSTYVQEMFKRDKEYYKNKLDISVIPDNEIGDIKQYTNFQFDENYNIRRYLKVVPGPVSIKDLRSNIIGGTCIIGSYGSEYETVSRSYKNSDDTKVRYFWNPGRNKNFEAAFLSGFEYTMGLDYLNINPKYLTPVTQYLLHCNTKELDGEYTLVGNRFEFTTTDYKNYTCSGLLTLAK